MTLFCQLRDSMSPFFEWHFFFCLLLRKIHRQQKNLTRGDSRTLGTSATIYRLVAIRYYHTDFFFRCHESPRSTSVNFCEKSFQFNQNVLVCFKFDVVKFLNLIVSKHPQVFRCLVNVCFFLIFNCKFISI